MYQKYGSEIQFFVVYVREAHPNRQYPQPKTIDQRVEHANTMCSTLRLSIPTLIDSMDNKVGLDYSGFPDRLYLIGTNGKIIYKGARGPFGFKPDQLESAIKKELKNG